MAQEIIDKIKNTRLIRKAQQESGLNDQIKALQKEIVCQSFSEKFSPEKHRQLMQQLKELKLKHKNIAVPASV